MLYTHVIIEAVQSYVLKMDWEIRQKAAFLYTIIILHLSIPLLPLTIKISVFFLSIPLLLYVFRRKYCENALLASANTII